MALISLKRHSHPITVRHCTFNTLKEAYEWANGLLSKTDITTSKPYDDLFEEYRPKDPYFALLGVEKKAEQRCRSLEPNGQWRVEVGEHRGLPRLQAWYSRYLPYAVAMLNAEDEFDCKGIEFESINSFYETCYGFNEIGFGNHSCGKGYDRIVPEDVSLYQDCYHTSCKVNSPSLPFEEAYDPALVYIAKVKPSIIAHHFDYDHNHPHIQHIRKCFEELGWQQPRFRWPKKAV